MKARVELKLEGSMDHLRLAWQTGETLLASVPFAEDPDGIRYNVLLSVQELLTNILRHGYSGDDTGPVQIVMEASPDGFSVELRDRGIAFDPLQHVRSDVEEGVPIEPGGYGLVIVRMVMDELNYRREDGWNVLTLSKSVHAGVAATATGAQA
ncbi:MAG: ATP-binding protein [Planctomycetes bacterium]|nr:ATP-binding protein [Planctomycetota bacterium]MCB9889985.1 ATP-binding protein [Planctomycetota bacterium]